MQAAELFNWSHQCELKPFLKSPADASGKGSISLSFAVAKTSKQVQFQFTLSGKDSNDLNALVIPAFHANAESYQRRDELWKNTCFELFIAPKDTDAYIEMNLSPSGDWNLYGFDSYRSGMHLVPGVRPVLQSFVRADQGRTMIWQGSLMSDPKADPESQATPDIFNTLFQSPLLVIGATSVLEYQDGRREYWALAHKGEKPDFHLRESFILEL